MVLVRCSARFPSLNYSRNSTQSKLKATEDFSCSESQVEYVELDSKDFLFPAERLQPQSGIRTEASVILDYLTRNHIEPREAAGLQTLNEDPGLPEYLRRRLNLGNDLQ